MIHVNVAILPKYVVQKGSAHARDVRQMTVPPVARLVGRCLLARRMSQLFIRESMTLFEVDRVFWMRQDFCLGEPLGEPRQKS